MSNDRPWIPEPLMAEHRMVGRLHSAWTMARLDFDEFARHTPENGYDYAQHDVLKRRAEIAEERYRKALGDYFCALDNAIVFNDG